MACSNARAFLRGIRLFRPLAADGSRLEESSRAVAFSKRSVLFQEGDSADGVWVLKEGCVKLVRSLVDGKRLTLDIRWPGEVFGRGVLGRCRHYGATAVAISDGLALRIPAALVLKWTHDVPDVAEAAAELLHERADRSEWMRLLSRKPVRERTMDILEDIAKRLGNEVPLSHQELADLAGARTETVIRVLAALRREGWLRKERGLIRLKRAAPAR